jgi:preprotein translocase subunit SecG
VYIFVVLVTILVALLLMVVILMQASKGGGLSATFGGGGGGDTMLSTRQAATVLHKVTIYLVADLHVPVPAGHHAVRPGQRRGPGSVTSSVLEQQSAASGFNPSIPKLELPAAGTPAGTEAPAEGCQPTRGGPGSPRLRHAGRGGQAPRQLILPARVVKLVDTPS